MPPGGGAGEPGPAIANVEEAAMARITATREGEKYAGFIRRNPSKGEI
jgi:hypothetical protein